MSAPRNSSESKKRRPKPATTPEGRITQLTSLAYEQAELQMREGNAPAPIVVHFLKAGTERDRLEVERLRRENILLERKAEQLATGERIESMQAEIMAAIREYQGIDEVIHDD